MCRLASYTLIVKRIENSVQSQSTVRGSCILVSTYFRQNLLICKPLASLVHV